MLNYEPRPTASARSCPRYSTLRLAAVAAVSSFILFSAYPALISELPRSGGGETVLVPWEVCLAGNLALPVLLPYSISLVVVRSGPNRVVFLLLLITSVTTWYFTSGVSGLLDKAWRRGL